MKPYDLKQRPLMDGELTDLTVAFIGKHAKAAKPFFCYVPYTLPHHPRLPHPDFTGKTRNGPWADMLAQTDAYVGEMLDAVDPLGLANNTIVIFTSDNGGDFFPDGSFPGPWAGTFFTGLEASLRVPFIVRWPGTMPAGRVSNEIVHQMDLFTTFAATVGGKVPTDRVIDGVDQLDFLTAKTDKSLRESVIVYVADQLYAVKWRNWKVVIKELDAGYGTPLKTYPTPVVFDLYGDPREEKPLLPTGFQQNGWVGGPVIQIVAAHLKTLRDEPPIKEGTPDPYVPQKGAEEAPTWVSRRAREAPTETDVWKRFKPAPTSVERSRGHRGSDSLPYRNRPRHPARCRESAPARRKPTVLRRPEWPACLIHECGASVGRAESAGPVARLRSPGPRRHRARGRHPAPGVRGPGRR